MDANCTHLVSLNRTGFLVPLDLQPAHQLVEATEQVDHRH